MKVNILTGVWKLESVNDEDVLMNTSFPRRVIRFNNRNFFSNEMLRHSVCHEVTHAFQAELGQWQNVMENGRLKDEFDCEWIAEFVAIYSENILRVTNEIVEFIKSNEIEDVDKT